ncbi:MAG: hypothetical protein ACD_63C00262G0005 [uncultured bacterium]|nr:MAG: hypothetical protein ACD_63C00262G0005 [uncultured bacterium]
MTEGAQDRDNRNNLNADRRNNPGANSASANKLATDAGKKILTGGNAMDLVEDFLEKRLGISDPMRTILIGLGLAIACILGVGWIHFFMWIKKPKNAMIGGITVALVLVSFLMVLAAIVSAIVSAIIPT